jgi:hypothetical protein
MPAKPVTDGLDTRKVAGETKRRNRKRTKSASVLRRINAAARDRQKAWAEGEQPNVTERLSTELNGPSHLLRPEGLFAESRKESAGEMQPGNPKTSGAFRG